MFVHRVSWVVLPQLFLMAAVNYLDRTSLSFASLQMNADLSLSTQQYGLAAAMFALGECRAAGQFGIYQAAQRVGQQGCWTHLLPASCSQPASQRTLAAAAQCFV